MAHHVASRDILNQKCIRACIIAPLDKGQTIIHFAYGNKNTASRLRMEPLRESNLQEGGSRRASHYIRTPTEVHFNRYMAVAKTLAQRLSS